MSPAELLAQFRALGGIADNVCIRPCQHGIGLFAVEPAQAVRVHTPAQLLIAPQLLELTPEAQLKVRSGSGLGAEVVAFHEGYLRSIAWAAGGHARIRAHYQALCALPDRLKHFLQIFGCTDDLGQPPTPQQAFAAYCISRQIRVQGSSRLMPVLELINHADTGAPYGVSPEGVSLSGRFAGEVLACYRQHLDAFHFFFNYHFAAPSRSALSCEVRIGLDATTTLQVSRWDGLSELREGARVPQVRTRKNEIQLSYVELVNQDAPALPRQVFVALLSEQGLPSNRAHALFDGLLAHNRQVLQDFLAACEAAPGPLTAQLKAVAGYQLDKLGRC
ncbi:hypothetical protein DIC66_11355 [Rhodoferax lacus]|uniref:Uncharacterized protein n=1 Tax=Rhodoferax lacus TaxID=2184758 RepID=A0A3E1RB87_9BURK|nr:hypothetical protein [Rhodoferax lacus]RFO96617.1 hypothetical protein DIC66_11355 [Rhodoferax lacus]